MEYEDFETEALFDAAMPALEGINPVISDFISSHGGDGLRKKLKTVFLMLESVNKTMNLTALHGEGSVLLHLFDSLMLAKTAETVAGRSFSVADIGCGGGFPSIPLAASLPGISLTSVDSTEKSLRSYRPAQRRRG